MTIIFLIVILILVGAALYLINSVIPMDSKIKMIMNVVVVILVLLYVLQAFGLGSGLDQPIKLN